MNSVICAATIEAINSGWEVYGIPDGFSRLMKGDTSHVRRLNVDDVSRIHLMGGSVLYTSRANPTKNPEHMQATVKALQDLGLDALVTIGGDDTGYSAALVSQAAGNRLKVAHVPKTIDNDLPLPGDVPTFGYQTARHVGANLVSNLMTDALTTRRWFFAVAMGRQAGHLAQGIGKSAGATLTVIPEDFPAGEPIHLDHIVEILETSIYKRIASGRPFGVAVLAEGLSLRFPPEEVDRAMPNAERDDHGHVRLSEVHLHRLLTDLVRKRLADRGHKVTIVAKNIGYELRSAPSSTRATSATAPWTTCAACCRTNRTSSAARWSRSNAANWCRCGSVRSTTRRRDDRVCARSTPDPRPTAWRANTRSDWKGTTSRTRRSCRISPTRRACSPRSSVSASATSSRATPSARATEPRAPRASPPVGGCALQARPPVTTARAASAVATPGAGSR
jgi:6-phosphofructokinase